MLNNLYGIHNFNFRQECQSYKLTVEDPVSLEYITRHVAGMKQRYTQSSGRRPFGISCLLTGMMIKVEK